MPQGFPTIVSGDLPAEGRPSNSFTVSVTVKQDGDGNKIGPGVCHSGLGDLDPRGWVTPVSLWVDGNVVESKTKCMNVGEEAEFSFTVPPLTTGRHDVSITTHPVGTHGLTETWKQNKEDTTDEIRQTITVSREARDPSTPSGSGKILQFLEGLANSLGTSVNMLALGIVVGGAVFLVI
jgi:hypothetical protein